MSELGILLRGSQGRVPFESWLVNWTRGRRRRLRWVRSFEAGQCLERFRRRRKRFRVEAGLGSGLPDLLWQRRRQDRHIAPRRNQEASKPRYRDCQELLAGLRSRARRRGPIEGRWAMPLTRGFNDLIKSRVAADPAFRQALLQEAVQTMLDGDVATAKSVLRDTINATIGFDRLDQATGTPAKNLMRMFGRQGNPTAEHLLGVSASCKGKPACASKWRLSRTRRDQHRCRNSHASMPGTRVPFPARGRGFARREEASKGSLSLAKRTLRPAPSAHDVVGLLHFPGEGRIVGRQAIAQSGASTTKRESPLATFFRPASPSERSSSNNSLPKSEFMW